MCTDLVEIEDVFFEAMASGWVSKPEEITVPKLPGSKAIPFELGDFKVLYCYMVTPYSDMSTGSTIIWHRGIPVWVMYYGGWYTEVAMPFLKQCLASAYAEERRFYGGRGPEFVRGERFTYVNRINRNNFNDFVGEERIYDLDEQCLGFHWYRGMSLLQKA